MVSSFLFVSDTYNCKNVHVLGLLFFLKSFYSDQMYFLLFIVYSICHFLTLETNKTHF